MAYKISMVEYQNALPFLHGLQNHTINTTISINLEVPSITASHFMNGDCDIALVPAFFLSQNPQGEMFSDYCIGSNEQVRTVALYSNKPIESVKEIFLDSDSLTSIHLAKILSFHFWNISPTWHKGLPLTKEDAYVAIGDKTFALDNQYTYKYDLVEEWKKFCGLPFAFAVWIAKKEIPNEFLIQFNDALKLGVESLPRIIEKNPTIEKYLTENISYHFDDDKKLALKKYLSLLKNIE